MRPLPVSVLGTHARRQAIARVTEKRWIFRDVARALKMLACLGYYGDPKGMASVGYVPFDDRERSHVDQAPKEHPEPTE